MANFIPNLDKIRDGANFLAGYVKKALEAIQAKFPITKFDIASVFGSVIDWTGAPTLPTEIIPWSDQPVGTSGSGVWGNCIDILRDCVVQYRDDDSLYFGPGFILHRGSYKRQSCNDDGTWVSAVAATLVAPDECPTDPGTTTGLMEDSWYFVYAKLDAAGEGPEYRISLVPPVRCDGYGPEHPAYEKFRFLGSFRTQADGVIRPFHRYHNGRVFWREITVGPQGPTFPLQEDSGSFVPIDVSDFVPLSADAAFFSYFVNEDDACGLSTWGDNAAYPSGYHTDMNGGKEDDGSAWAELPVNVLQSNGLPATTPVRVRWRGRTVLAAVGYHEALL